MATTYHLLKEKHLNGSIVTVGSFDGVHRGHRLLLRRMAELAGQYHAGTVVVTFWPHPRQVLTNNAAPLLLTDVFEKYALLGRAGIDTIVQFRFSEELSQMSATDFLRDIIIDKINPGCLVIGKDHHFGKNRHGNIDSLPELLVNSNLPVEVVDLKTDGCKISSSAIRAALAEGNLASANSMLGYEYMISGKVIGGNHLGRTIGFPTANIDVAKNKLLPKEGVYRVKVYLGDVNSCVNNNNQHSHTGMLYVGKRYVLPQPDTKPQVEVNILGFDGDIYEKPVTLALTHRIRNDIRFENMEQLTARLIEDKNIISKISS